MTEHDGDGDELILERLRESASGDAAVRQLRRRYDTLRRDYEQLLDRLGELEERLDAQPQPVSQSPAPAAAAGATQLADLILAPLLKLRDEYVAAVSGINSVVAGLDRLAAGAFKGQHGPPPASLAEDAAETSEQTAPQRTERPKRVQVDVRGSGFGELLDFQERLSSLDGVARVSINAIDTERATLVVELEPAGARRPSE